MTPAGPVASFHPEIPGDLFFWERAVFDQECANTLRTARAVVLPQTVSLELYWFCRANCPHVFPDYDQRFRLQGKVGDAMLFWSTDTPHPRTLVYPRVETLVGTHPEMGLEKKLPSYPFVLKANCGGEGRANWLVQSEKDLGRILHILERREWQKDFGFVVQEYIAGLDRDLRVVVIGETVISYWRIAGQDFHANISQGGEIDEHGLPALQAAGRRAVMNFCRKTGINLAAFDLVFSDNQPLFLEINYTFGRRGLKGCGPFQKIFRSEVDKWLERLSHC